jgi:hypothetical protein
MARVIKNKSVRSSRQKAWLKVADDVKRHPGSAGRNQHAPSANANVERLRETAGAIRLSGPISNWRFFETDDEARYPHLIGGVEEAGDTHRRPPRRRQKPAPAPPPTNVRHSPQSSMTTKWTVVACPGVARSTAKSTATVLAGTVRVCPLTTGWPFSVTLAF